MAKNKYPNSAQSMLDDKMLPGARPTAAQQGSLAAEVRNAVNIIDSPMGPTNPTTGALVYPGWQSMNRQEKIEAVIRTMKSDAAVKATLGNLRTRFGKAVRNEYAKKHTR